MSEERRPAWRKAGGKFKFQKWQLPRLGTAPCAVAAGILPAVEPRRPARRKNRTKAVTSGAWRVMRLSSAALQTSGRRSGRQDAALYGRRDACRYQPAAPSALTDTTSFLRTRIPPLGGLCSWKTLGRAACSPGALVCGRLRSADWQPALGARSPVLNALEPDRRPSCQTHAKSRSQTQPPPKALAGRAGAPPPTGA